MTNIQKRLESIVSKELAKNIIPVKTDEGILVGDVHIVNQANLKHLYKKNVLCYKDISLNKAAIYIANILAVNQHNIRADAVYRADQEYGKWFTDSQMLRAQYQKYLNNKAFDKADHVWARYQESREKALNAKKYVESLISF